MTVSKLTKSLLAGVVATSLFATSAMASHRYDNDGFYTHARVIHVEPVYEYIKTSYPNHRCYKERRRSYSNHRDSATPTIVGAIIGGAIGNAIGHNKTNKRIGTAAGAILGGSIGHDIGEKQRHSSYGYKTVTHCHDSYHKVRTRRELTGYEVIYSYQGERYETFTRNHPGKRLKVKVNVVPVEY